MNTIEKTLRVEIDKNELDVLNKAKGLVEFESFIIENNEQSIHSTNLLKLIKVESKELEEKRKSLTQPLNDTMKKINEMYKPTITLLKDAEGTIKQSLITFMERLEAMRLKEEAIAIAKAEALEDKRIKNLQDRAKTASEKGNDKMAEKLNAQAENVHVPIVVKSSEFEKQKGISTVERWKAEVIDKSKIPLNYMIVDIAMLNKIAIATKGTLEISGVKFYKESSMSVRIA
jgi:hypothetical protein